jgi:hypothetical protein
MEGRWAIQQNNTIYGVHDQIGGRDVPRVVTPVVPCDDAAIERATEAAMTAIVESDDVIAHGDEPYPGWALKLAERAIAAGFRAAGEMT